MHDHRGRRHLSTARMAMMVAAMLTALTVSVPSSAPDWVRPRVEKIWGCRTGKGTRRLRQFCTLLYVT